MSSREYFDALCKASAGEFIYRTVEGVKGITQLRPRGEATDYMLQHLHALEDPFGDVTEGGAARVQQMLVRPSRYEHLDRTSLDSAGRRSQVLRVLGSKPDPLTDSFGNIAESEVQEPARYGFTWRGFEVPHGRDMGVAGSELIILELRSNEILAVRRGFIRTGDVSNIFTKIWWPVGHLCPSASGRSQFYAFEFLTKVMQPSTRREGKHANR